MLKPFKEWPLMLYSSFPGVFKEYYIHYSQMVQQKTPGFSPVYKYMNTAKYKYFNLNMNYIFQMHKLSMIIMIFESRNKCLTSKQKKGVFSRLPSTLMFWKFLMRQTDGAIQWKLWLVIFYKNTLRRAWILQNDARSEWVLFF